MDIHLVDSAALFAHPFWVVGYGLVLTLLLGRAVSLSSSGQHAQANLIAKLVAVGSLVPLGSWLIAPIGGPWIFGAVVVGLMLLSIAHTLVENAKEAQTYQVANK